MRTHALCRRTHAWALQFTQLFTHGCTPDAPNPSHHTLQRQSLQTHALLPCQPGACCCELCWGGHVLFLGAWSTLLDAVELASREDDALDAAPGGCCSCRARVKGTDTHVLPARQLTDNRLAAAGGADGAERRGHPEQRALPGEA